MGECAKFCDGCKLGNGVSNISNEKIRHNLTTRLPNPGFDILLVDAADSDITSLPIRAHVGNFVDNTMPTATYNDIKQRVEDCNGPITTTEQVSRLGRFLGRLFGTREVEVERCGAFPDQDPANIEIAASSDGWRYEDWAPYQ